MCFLAVWLSATLALCLGCSTRSTPEQSQVAVRVGFGFGGTALAGALPTLVDTLSAEPLITIAWNGRPQPKLASEWKWSEDGRMLRLRLRKGVVFHDGTPLTAEAVVADLQRLLGEPGYARRRIDQRRRNRRHRFSPERAGRLPPHPAVRSDDQDRRATCLRHRSVHDPQPEAGAGPRFVLELPPGPTINLPSGRPNIRNASRIVCGDDARRD